MTSPLSNQTPLHDLIINILNDNKAQSITDLDVTHLTDITDRVIICTATSQRHAKTLADKLLETSKKHQHPPLSHDTSSNSDWLLIDYADIVVHIMLKDAREFYSLEKLWNITALSRKDAQNPL